MISRRTFLSTCTGVATIGSLLPTLSAPPASYPIVDIHCHPRWLAHDASRMIANMDAAGIDKAWLISWEAPEREISPNYYEVTNPAAPGIPFADVVELCERFPDRFIAGTTVDPRDPHAHQKLKAAVDIHNVKVFGEFKLRMRYDDPDCIRLFAYCGTLGLPVIFHLDVTFPRNAVPESRQWWYGGSLENMKPALELCPDTVFIGHAPGFWREISGNADEGMAPYPVGEPVTPGGLLPAYMAAYPNLYCDLSAGSAHTALSRDLDFTREFLTEYQDRMLFGRDAWDNRLYDLLMDLELEEAVLEKIFYQNAHKLVPVS